jgi:protein TonB
MPCFGISQEVAAMLAIQRLSALVLVLGVSTACGTRPTAQIDAAHGARDRAAGANAAQYAPDSQQAADQAHAALAAELAAQDARWFKSYDRARELAARARWASEKAADDAAAARARVDADEAAGRAAVEHARRVAATTPVRVGGAIRKPAKITDVTPLYPPIAKSARVGGTVQVELTVGRDGRVEHARVVKSVPLLDQAALDAVKQWTYRPTKVRNVAVPVVMDVAITFEP